MSNNPHKQAALEALRFVGIFVAIFAVVVGCLAPIFVATYLWGPWAGVFAAAVTVLVICTLGVYFEALHKAKRRAHVET